jgi:serine/threonine protein kinase
MPILLMIAFACRITETILAPEYDLWALGVVLYVVLKRYLWANPMETDVTFSSISSGEFAAIYKNLKNRNEVPEISSDLVDLIQNLFLKEPNQRFTLEQVSAHRWMIPF